MYVNTHRIVLNKNENTTVVYYTCWQCLIFSTAIISAGKPNSQQYIFGFQPFLFLIFQSAHKLSYTLTRERYAMLTKSGCLPSFKPTHLHHVTLTSHARAINRGVSLYKYNIEVEMWRREKNISDALRNCFL